MGNYIQQEYDFIYRTKMIIEQYENLEIPKNEKFEVTLLLNCLVGLLILPQQVWYDGLPDTTLKEENWGIKEEDILFIKNGEAKNIKNISRHLRNSVSHYRFKAFDNESKEISHIKFEDFTDKVVKTFEADITVTNIRKFTTKLTEIFISEMKK